MTDQEQPEYTPPLKLDCFTWDPEPSERHDVMVATGTVELVAWDEADKAPEAVTCVPNLSQNEALQPLPRAAAGRPAKVLDLALVEKFASVGMPVEKIALFFNCSRQTLYGRCGELLNACRTKYEFDIWMRQKELADAGDHRMLVHLGKTMLRQSEALPTEVDESSDVEWTVKAPVFKKPKQLTQDERDELEGEQ